MGRSRKRGRTIAALCFAALAAGCVKQAPQQMLPFAFDARPTWGEVRVLPVMGVHEQVPVNLESFVGAPLTEPRQRVRQRRTWQLQHQVPTEVAWALPGELNGSLGDTWGGQFLAHRYPPGTKDRMRSALAGQRDLDTTLGEVARTVGGNATLLCWVREISGEPLSVRGLPGEVVQTAYGPVVLDHDDEPYLVTAQVGMALVARDGEVVVRYEDEFSTLLSGRQRPEHAGRDLASALADEVSMVWAIDPRLQQHEPEAPAPIARTRTLGVAADLAIDAGPAAFAPTMP